MPNIVQWWKDFYNGDKSKKKSDKVQQKDLSEQDTNDKKNKTNVLSSLLSTVFIAKCVNCSRTHHIKDGHTFTYCKACQGDEWEVYDQNDNLLERLHEGETFDRKTT